MLVPPPSDSTRGRLILAGLFLFGRKGFDGTSTRELAERAETNVASIAYHFGSKQGLREACARAVAERVSGAFDSAAARPPETPEAARDMVEAAARSLVRLMLVVPEARDMVAFMVQELGSQSDLADQLFSDFIEPRHRRLSTLWALAAGREPEEPEVKLAAFAMVGQILYFRIALPFVARRMDWAEAGEAEAMQIAETVAANVRADIERLRQ